MTHLIYIGPAPAALWLDLSDPAAVDALTAYAGATRDKWMASEVGGVVEKSFGKEERCVIDPTKPCLNCPDRHPACSDHCNKPEYIADKERRQKIRTGRNKYTESIGVAVASCQRTPWYGKE